MIIRTTIISRLSPFALSPASMQNQTPRNALLSCASSASMLPLFNCFLGISSHILSQISSHSHHQSHHFSQHPSMSLSSSLILSLSHRLIFVIALSLTWIISCNFIMSHNNKKIASSHHHILTSALQFVASHSVIIAPLREHHQHPFQTFQIQSEESNDRFLNMSSSAPLDLSIKTNLH